MHRTFVRRGASRPGAPLPSLPTLGTSLLALLLGGWLLSAAGCGGGKGAAPPPPDLVLMASGGLFGTIEPCGCKDGLGGLHRRVGVLRAWHEAHPAVPYLYMDAGRGWPMRTSETHVVVPAMKEAFQLVGVDVMNVADSDLVAGFSPYAAIANDAPWKTVSANLVSIDGDRPVFAPFVVVTPRVGPDGKGAAAGPRVAILGLASPERYEVMDGLRGDKIHWIDIQKALTRWLPEARAQADLVVVLANFGSGTGRLIAHRFPEVDLVLACDRTNDVVSHAEFGATHVVMTGTLGKYDARLEFRRNPASERWSLNLVSTALDETVPHDMTAGLFMKGVKADLEDAGRRFAELSKPDPNRPAYIGSEACAPCHAAEVATWRGTKHAHAWETLVDTKNTMNPLCLHCHTVGYMKPNGYVMGSAGESLTDVGCESCHGPGGPHAKNPTAAKMDPAGPETCANCHTPGQTPDFDFESFWPKIAHGRPRQS
jgi:hypothetical protein